MKGVSKGDFNHPDENIEFEKISIQKSKFKWNKYGKSYYST